MHTRQPGFDPTKDPVAADVIEAFDHAQKAGLPSFDCYEAGVHVWQRAHPRHSLHYASAQAVELILRAKTRRRT